MNYAKNTVVFSFVLILVVLFAACSNDDDRAGTASEVVTKATINGTVLENDSIPSEAVNVLLYKTGTVDSLISTQNTSSGIFQFDSLAAGEYRISVMLDSIEVGSESNIVLTGNETVTITINISIVITQNFYFTTNTVIQNIIINNGTATLNEDGSYTISVPDSTSQEMQFVIPCGDSLIYVDALLITKTDGTLEVSYLDSLPDTSLCSDIASSSSSSAVSSSSSPVSSSSVSHSSSSTFTLSSSSVNISSSSSIPLSSSSVSHSSSSTFTLSSSSVNIGSSSSISLSSSSLGLSSSSVIIPEAWMNPDAEFGSFTDIRDNQVYLTVEIGTQTWMAQNLNFASENSLCYAGESTYCETYGRLYSWAEAMSISLIYNSAIWGGASEARQGVCPSGWHLPTAAEWDALASFLGTNSAGKILKTTTGWDEDGNGTDNYGFGAQAAGLCDGSGTTACHREHEYGVWFTATEVSNYKAEYRFMYKTSDNISMDGYGKFDAFSIRCVMNAVE